MSQKNNYLLNSDQTVNLEDASLPIQAFSCYALFGLKNSGKTTQSFNMLDSYLDQASKHINDYDLMNFRNLNGQFTSIYYISPSESTDRTLQEIQEKYIKNKGLSKYSRGINIIQGTKENILASIDYIKQEVQDLNDFCKDQIQILQLLQQDKTFIEKIRGLKYEMKYGSQFNISMEDKALYNYLQQFCKQLEIYKQQYPQDKYDNIDKQTLNNLKEFESILEVTYNIQNYKPCFIRYPKTALILDDLSSSSLLTNTIENPLFKFLNQSRHFALFYCAINVHSLSIMYNSFKVCLTGMLLFNGLNLEKVEDLFGVISKLDSKDFGKKDFVNLYKDVEGYNLSYKERIDQGVSYDFLYVVITPQIQIWYNFQEQLM